MNNDGFNDNSKILIIYDYDVYGTPIYIYSKCRLVQKETWKILRVLNKLIILRKWKLRFFLY